MKNVKYKSFLMILLLSNKKLNLIATELFITGRELNISTVFITQSYFSEPKNRLNYTRYFTMKIPNKQELQHTVFDHSSDIDFKDFMSLYKKCTSKPTTESTTKPEVTKELATEPEVATEPTKATKAKTKRKISLLKFREKFLNEIGN